jgi:cyclohexanecarboxylate-CoA ligase
MSNGPFETIEFAVDEHVATITLNRPERLNSFNEMMAEEITEAWRRVRQEDSIHAAVLQANGEKAFCTGIDVKEGAWVYQTNKWNEVDPGAALGPKHHKVWKPVIAAVHGMCAGGGHYFINECDIIICSENATFFDPHASVGIVSALEPIGLLFRGIPLGEVLRWALTGNEERMSAATALRIGLVSEVVATQELRSRANEIAQRIARRRPQAIQGTVRAIWEALDMTRTIAIQNGLSYTQIGNPTAGGPRQSYALDGPPSIR